MKFLLHNLLIIRSRFRSYGWVLAELFVVFLVMWYLCDSLGCMGYTRHRPLGMDIDHVYQLSIIPDVTMADSTAPMAKWYFDILERVQALPEVECASLSYWSLPMSGQNSYRRFKANDSVGLSMRRMRATGDYFRVFRIATDPDRPFASMPVSENDVQLSEATYRYLSRKVKGFSLDTPLYSYYDTTYQVKLHGTYGPMRQYRYGADDYSMMSRTDRAFAEKEYGQAFAQIVFRLKPAADTPDFRARFDSEVAPRLDAGKLYVSDAVPYTSQQYLYEVMTGDSDRVNTQVVITVFLLANVFLGLIGTFWYRTRRRRSEIGLRMSMGSSRRGIFSLLMGEGLLLLTLAALPAMLVCLNVAWAEPTVGSNELISTWPVEWSFGRFLLGSLGAWTVMALMVAAGIWFPARQAMRVQPAEALHEE